MRSVKVEIVSNPLVYEVLSHCCTRPAHKYWVQLPEIAIPDLSVFNISGPANEVQGDNAIVHRSVNHGSGLFKIEQFLEGIQIVSVDAEPAYQLNMGDGRLYSLYAHLNYDRNCYFPYKTDVKQLLSGYSLVIYN